MRLDGGGGDNWLVGGAGNDWIYGGWLGNSHLDTGVSGDSVVIGGEGANVFYNTSDGSQCFIWVGTGDVWASYGHDANDGLIRLAATDPNGRVTWRDTRTYNVRPWTEIETLRISDYAQQTYDVIGNYAFFRAGSDGSVYCMLNAPILGLLGVVWHGTNHTLFYGMPTFGTFVHEVAHFHHVPSNSAWVEFSTISWSHPDSLFGGTAWGWTWDFANEYGMANKWEDWASAVERVVAGSNNGWAPTGSSDVWYRKVDLVHQFFAYLNPNYVHPTEIRDPLHIPFAVTILDITFDSITLE